MNPSQFQYAEMILQALDGQMSDEQFAEFDRLLRQDSSFRQYYLKFMAINTSLGAIDKFPAARMVGEQDDSVLSHDLWSQLAHEEQTAETVEIEVPRQKPQIVKVEHIDKAPRKINKFSLVSAVISAAALVFLLLYIHFAPVKSTSLVGRLSRTLDAQWQDASGHITEGCDLYSGPMNLTGGYAEIVLDSGAVIIVQAPSRFTLESPQQLFLQDGQIVARKTGSGEQAFLVRTPQASIVDYGTEFGVRVDATGQTETFVYEGQVQIRDSSDPIKFMNSRLLTAGQSAVADTERNIVGKWIDPKAFIRPKEMDVRYRAHKEEHGYYRWRASIYQLHRDPSLVAHYIFEKTEDAPQRLINAMFPDQEIMQGIFGDQYKDKPAWVQGRWPQKDALCFERAKQQGIVIAPETSLSVTFPLTLSTWVSFPDANRWGGHLISCRQGKRINYQFSLFDKNYVYDYQKNRFEFRQYQEIDTAGVGFYSEPFVPQPGKWYHFAVVYDGVELKFYVNGDLFQAAPYKGLPPGTPAEIIIGAVKKNDEYVFEEGDFEGVVDELMLFNRTLSQPEVQAIYETGKP